MKRVLIIGATLVALLAVLFLWLSVDPPPGPKKEMAGESVEDSAEPLAPGTESSSGKENIAQAPTPPSADPKVESEEASSAPPPEKDSGFRPITQLGPASERTRDESDTAAQPPTPDEVTGQESPRETAARSPTPESQSTGETPETKGAAAKPAVSDDSMQSSTEDSRTPPRDTAAPAERVDALGTEEPARSPQTEPSQVEARPPRSRRAAPAAPRPPTVRTPPPARQRPPAPPGRYETVTRATARARPSDTAPIVDRINPGTFLNVTGSEGDWLVVYSQRKNITVFVKRDEAMLTQRQPATSTTVPESEWPRVEREILQAFARNNVNGVEVTFIADTAYLKGTVGTERERERAEIFARSVLEVEHVLNGIRVE